MLRLLYLIFTNYATSVKLLLLINYLFNEYSRAYYSNKNAYLTISFSQEYYLKLFFQLTNLYFAYLALSFAHK